MPGFEIELKPVDFLTVGTVGPRGKRVFYIQGSKGDELVTLIVEKMQVSALAEAIVELLADIGEDHLEAESNSAETWDMELRDPIIPRFRVSQIGLGYNEETSLIVLVTQELVSGAQEETETAGVVRFWGTQDLMRLLAKHAESIVSRGRPDPQKNGRIHYYWT
jgi:uncharacterized repeat protein (TIGR03847 family)